MERKVSTAKKATVGKTKKTTTKKKTHHKARMHGAKDLEGQVMRVAGVLVGVLGARKLNAIAVNVFPSVASSPILSGGAQAAIGFVLPKFVKGQFMADVGLGMMAQGATVILTSALPSVFSGTGDMLSYNIPALRGVSNLPAIALNGVSNLPIVTGKVNSRVQSYTPALSGRTPAGNWEIFS